MAIERAQALERDNAVTHVQLCCPPCAPRLYAAPAELQLPELSLACKRQNHTRGDCPSNQHRIRPQADKNLPSGHLPDDALQHPEMFGCLRCQVPIPKEVINELRPYLTEVVGPREAHLSICQDGTGSSVPNYWRAGIFLIMRG